MLYLLTNVMQQRIALCFRTEQMMIVAGDYKVNIFEGTEQYAKPHSLVTHPLYNRSTNNADIMLIKVLQEQCGKVTSDGLKWLLRAGKTNSNSEEMQTLCFLIIMIALCMFNPLIVI